MLGDGIPLVPEARRLLWNMTSSAGGLAAVDVEDFAGHEAAPFEEEDRVDTMSEISLRRPTLPIVDAREEAMLP